MCEILARWGARSVFNEAAPYVVACRARQIEQAALEGPVGTYVTGNVIRRKSRRDVN